VTHNGSSSWRFAYALMAGVSVDINCALKADVGYRYRKIKGGGMFGYVSNGGPGYDRGFHNHEVRGGLRYTFGGCKETAYVPPVTYPPQVYK
jgi:opacity protein-like surface antigen